MFQLGLYNYYEIPSSGIKVGLNIQLHECNVFSRTVKGHREEIACCSQYQFTSSIRQIDTHF